MKGSEMPQKPCYKVIWDEEGDEIWNDWLSSLQLCEIDESEYDKIGDYLLSNRIGTRAIFNEGLDVTDIVEDNNGVITFKETNVTTQIVREAMRITAKDVRKPQCVIDGLVKPKQVDGEIEAVDVLLNTFGQFCTLNGIKLTDSNKVGQAVIDFLKSDIYEIFKNK